MMIHPAILEHYPHLNDAQRSVVGHLDGPLLVVAGPGSGKTYCIVLRALNLLLLGQAAPGEVILCTFTEKAAFEMRDRIAAAACKIGYKGDLSELTVSIIHGFCNRVLQCYRHRTPLGHNYETLDELTQLLFLFDHLDEIVRQERDGLYLRRWRTRWTVIEGVRSYFDKITEELVEPEALLNSGDDFLRALGKAYLAYRRVLLNDNHVDFVHFQRLVHDLLADPDVKEHVTRQIKFVLLVGEYQDTNYVQEQLLLKLTENTRNLCVVGDEDQSFYHFRGATVRNILEFPQRLPGCKIVKLETNYRSHRSIVERYDRWMSSADRSNPNGVSFRYDKAIQADPGTEYPEYPVVFTVWGRNRRDEAERFTEMVAWLKDNEVIQDYSQVALLLHSIPQEHKGCLPAPRASRQAGGEVAGAIAELAAYVDQAVVDLARRFAAPHPLARALQDWTAEIAGLEEGEAFDVRPADYLCRLLAVEPSITAVENENAARNLAVFSRLLNAFQTYYHYTVVTHRNRAVLRLHLFNSFLRLLHEGGINEYEDLDQPFPKGHVQVMTIHQAKGLEFPAVVVGSLATWLSSPKQIDRDLGPFYHRPTFELEDRITLFDRMRLHYVAFSRVHKVLVLTTHERPKDYFAPIWQGLP